VEFSFPNPPIDGMLTARQIRTAQEISTLLPAPFFFFLRPFGLRQYLAAGFVLSLFIGGHSARAASCKIAATHTPSEADQAFLHSDYERALTLYQEQLQQKPNDPALTSSLAQVFLRQQQIKEADDVIKRRLPWTPNPLFFRSR
jgi:Tetratricopeptide repeat